MFRTGGINFIHVFEIDYFADYTKPILTDAMEEELFSHAMSGAREIAEPIPGKIERSCQGLLLKLLTVVYLKLVSLGS